MPDVGCRNKDVVYGSVPASVRIGRCCGLQIMEHPKDVSEGQVAVLCLTFGCLRSVYSVIAAHRVTCYHAVAHRVRSNYCS